MTTQIIDSRQTLLHGPGGERGVLIEQTLPDSFLTNLAERRAESDSAPSGDLLHFASIPAAVVEKWRREGFDVFSKAATVQEISKRLRAEDLTKFLATNKRV